MDGKIKLDEYFDENYDYHKKKYVLMDDIDKRLNFKLELTLIIWFLQEPILL